MDWSALVGNHLAVRKALSITRVLTFAAAMGSFAWFMSLPAQRLAWAGGPDWRLMVKAVFAVGPGLALSLGIGRTILWCLPAGWPGSHRYRGLLFTLATSHFLGIAALTFQSDLYQTAGVPLATRWIVTPWLFLIGARWFVGSGGMLTRREVAYEPPTFWARAVGWITIAAVLTPFVLWAAPIQGRTTTGSVTSVAEFFRTLTHWRVQGAFPPLGLLHWPALLIIVVNAMERARRSPFWRRTTVLLLASVPFTILAIRDGYATLELPLFFGAGCAFSVGWLRRADRRSVWLSAIGFGACGLISPAAGLIGVGGLIALFLGTPRPSKHYVVVCGTFTTVLGLLPDVLSGQLIVFVLELFSNLGGVVQHSPIKTSFWALIDLARAGATWAEWGAAWPAFAFVLVAFGLRRVLRRRVLEERAGIDTPRREIWTLLAASGAALGLQVLLAGRVMNRAVSWPTWIGGSSPHHALMTLAPVAILLVGLIALPPENPQRRHSGPGRDTDRDE